MYYTNKLIWLIIFSFTVTGISGQSINMYFPQFAGKTYDFITFVGKDTKVQKGTIPRDGRFVLNVPKEFSPYKGMSRWLITNTQEGGGLDMIIPGRDFSIECVSAVPDNKNIIYKDNDENSLLDSQYKQQKSIVDQFTAMAMVTRAYPKDNKNYNLYQQELTLQKNNYSDFQKSLLKKEDYASNFLRIVNLTNGLGAALKENEEDNGKEIVRTITKDISWDALFTSGHWDSVIEMFTALEEKKDGGTIFMQDFKRIGDRISDVKLYTAFAERVTYYLTKSGNDNIITKLSPIILNSGKVSSYAGVMAVYQKATVGGKAPELTISSQKISEQSRRILDFTDKSYKKTLVVFYASDCGHCDAVMKELSTKQDELIKSGIRIVAISADSDQKVFEETSKSMQWKGLLSCDLQGMKGSNFISYGVQATPTLFVIDQQGKIVTRESTVELVLKALADPSTELWRKIRRPPRPYVAPQQ